MRSAVLRAGWRRLLLLPEVEHSQIDAHSSVWNLYRPVHHGDLLPFHRTRPVGLPANHKLTCGSVNADGADTEMKCQRGGGLNKNLPDKV